MPRSLTARGPVGRALDERLHHAWTEMINDYARARRHRRLTQGYEADFLALDGNPLVEFDATRRIRLRVKAGTVITP